MPGIESRKDSRLVCMDFGIPLQDTDVAGSLLSVLK